MVISHAISSGDFSGTLQSSDNFSGTRLEISEVLLFLITDSISQESSGSGSGTYIIWHQTRIFSLLTFSFDYTHGL
jgi:hypothetical protein